MQSVTLTKTGQYAIFQLSDPYENIEYIRTFTESISGIGTLQKHFRWSTDGIVWSYWTELTQSNLNSVVLDPDNKFYIEYKYQLTTQGHITIENIQIEPSYIEVDTNKEIVLPTLTCGQCGVDRASILNVCNATFNPYAVNPAMNLYNELSTSIQDMFGMEVLYMKATPKERSGDVIFKEWTLYTVEEPICTKVMVQDNEFPSDAAQYDMYGIGYEQPFEIEIVKKNFEADFGLDAAPQKGDILYFNLIGNRLYEIQSSTPVRGFMMEITSWKCELTIYKDKSNRDTPSSVTEIMDDIMRTSDELFGEELENETKQDTKPQQFDVRIGTTQQDPTRLYTNPNIVVAGINLQNHGTMIADHFYDMSSIFEPNEEVVGITYRAYSNFTESQNFAFTSWVKITNPKYAIPEDPVKILGRTGNVLTVQLSNLRNYLTGSLVQIYRQGRLNFYGSIVEKVNEKTYKIAMSADVVEYLTGLSASWASAPGYYMKLTFANTLINGFGQVGTPGVNTGWKLELIANRYLLYTDGDNVTTIPLGEDLVTSEWYGLVFNVAPQFRQINFNVWQISTDRRNTGELSKFFTYTLNDIDSNDKNFGEQFQLLAGNHYQTNIRLFKQIIPEDQQSTILNQYIVGDSDEAIIVDNAKPLLRLPWSGETK